MQHDLSITQLILDASLLVQLVMASLVLASLISWVIIIGKRGALGAIKRRADKFEDAFWSGGQLADIHERLSRNKKQQPIGMENVFLVGFEEFSRQRRADNERDDAVASIHRAMRVALARETGQMESGLPILATIGSTSPYVGLFGTVWGIMTAFLAIGGAGQATLAQVAPGIAEALIATAMGLFAAIPAVVAYNLFTSRVDALESRFETFAEELLGILERGFRGASGRVSTPSVPDTSTADAS